MNDMVFFIVYKSPIYICIFPFQYLVFSVSLVATKFSNINTEWNNEALHAVRLDIDIRSILTETS
jgi:hypothetical protein